MDLEQPESLMLVGQQHLWGAGDHMAPKRHVSFLESCKSGLTHVSIPCHPLAKILPTVRFQVNTRVRNPVIFFSRAAHSLGGATPRLRLSFHLCKMGVRPPTPLVAMKSFVRWKVEGAFF